MRVIARKTTPIQYAVTSFKEFLHEMNDFLYGTRERANRSIGIAFLSLVLLQGWGLLNSAPIVCSL